MDEQSSTRRLAEFGYRVENFFKKKPCYILATCKNLWSKYGNFWKTTPPPPHGGLKNGNFGLFIFQKNAFVHVTTLYMSPSGKILPQKK
jgi:hypothetical protein